MRFWKLHFPGDAALDECVSSGTLPPTSSQSHGLKNTDQEVSSRMRAGDGVVVGELVGDRAKMYAVGRVLTAEAAGVPPTIRWAKTLNYRQPDERGGLIHWQTKTAFEISASPAERYGLGGLIEHYLRGDA